MTLYKSVVKDKTLNGRPYFQRCRTIEIIDNKYASCSCGLPVRYSSFPCRHMLALFRSTSIKMFGIRWLIQYQHSYQRKDKKELTAVFRKMQEKEFLRNLERGQDVNVEDNLSHECFNRPDDTTYPVPIHGTTEEQMETVLDLCFHVQNGNPIVRGSVIPSRFPEKRKKDACPALDDDVFAFDEDNYEEECTVQYSQQTQEMINDDMDFRKKNNISALQRCLADMAGTISNSSDNWDQKLTGVVRELNKVTNGRNDKKNKIYNDLLGMLNQYTREMIESENESDGNNDEEYLTFPETGMYNSRKVKRQKILGD